MQNYWKELLSWLVFFPAALLCFLPMRNQLRLGRRGTAVTVVIALALALPVLALLDAAFPLGYNTLTVPAAALCLVSFALLVKASFSQSLAIFMLVCTFFSFLGDFSIGFDAALHPDSSVENFSLEAAVFQFVICILFSGGAFYPLWKYGGWLIDNCPIHSVWYLDAMASGIILWHNIRMYPRRYETIHINNVTTVYYTSLILLSLFLLFLCAVFYAIVKGMLELFEKRERFRTLEMEESQYRKQHRYMEESAAARHDFRHTIGVLEELLTAGDYEAATDYIRVYRSAQPRNEVVRYSGNTALNAMLNYYAQISENHHIQVRYVADLPPNLPLSDVDLCSIVGNLLDNAVNACCEIPEEERRINLTLSCPNDVRFGIAASNSFNGKVRMDGQRYLSTRRGGGGLGLASVTAAADRYGGTVRFHHEGREFFSGVLIPIKSEEAG